MSLWHTNNILALLRRPSPKPRELSPCGTGAFLSDQQYCYEKGWKEGIAAYRKMLRDVLEQEPRPNGQ